MRKYLFIFVLAALFLAACRAESNVIIDIEEDGSAVVNAEIGFDEEMLDLLSQTGEDPSELFTQDLPPEADGIEPYTRTEGDMTFYGVSTAVDDLENNAALDFGQDFAADFATFSYTTEGDEHMLIASIASADVGGGLGDLPIDPTDITGDIFTANLIVSMPGNVTEHNADEVRGDGSLVWNIPLTGSVDVSALSETGSSSSSWILWVLVGVLGVGIIAAVTATILSRKESKNAVEAAAAQHAAVAEQEATEDTNESEESDDQEDQKDTNESEEGTDDSDEQDESDDSDNSEDVG